MAAAAPRKPAARSRVAKRRDPLAKYRAKRDFVRTREPRGSRTATATARFVVQKHAATRLHFDFRLEIDGVLKSWAVPKGIPTEPGQRNLAVMVEDHPLDYGGFEGTIPKGQYGGGTVMLWDRGTFRVGGDDPARALREGKLHLYLKGEKLRGEWALVRLRGEDNQWLLLKVGEPLKLQHRTLDRSVATGRKMEEIATAAEMPAFVEPMKAKPASALPRGDDWLYELKFDGYRFIGAKAGRDVRLWSRAEKDFTSRFPAVTKALVTLKAQTALVDGELVVTDEQGRPSFQLIQNADESTPVRAFLFDLLEIDGENLRNEPLTERRARLAAILPKHSATLLLSSELAGDPDRLLAEIAERGLEGVIAKRCDSAYEAGRRSGAWRKIKCVLEQEFVIGGFTVPKGARSHFGALLLGYYRGKELIFAGKVGTGFNQKTLVNLHRQMTSLRTAKCPFATLPTQRGRWGTTFTRAELARCTWVEPKLVAQIRFTEWTEDGILRHPAFLGLRDDKRAREVVRETA
jgi:bifunctional non-homologous end joining protein LigD